MTNTCTPIRLFFPSMILATALLCTTPAAAPPLINVKKDICYKTIGKKQLHLDLYYPEGKLSGKYPLVIYTHGGGWAAGSKRNAAVGNMAKAVHGLTQKGFCVASVDYRLYKKGGTISMRDCVTDSKDAIRFLARNSKPYSVDPERVFTFGDSAGGHIAQMLLLSASEALPGDDELKDQTYKIIAGVSWYGPCDFEKTELFNHDDREDFRDRFGPRILSPESKPEDTLKLYREMSPINYLKKDSPPLLMIQGDADTTIPVKHAYYMQEKAKSIGAAVEIMIIKHAGHNWRKADKVTPIEPTAEQLIQRTIDFIVEHQNEK
jgi:acetyl esterase/lipase